MTKLKKALGRVLSGTADANIAFADLRYLLLRLEFDERIRGDHHIYTRDDVQEILNLQPKNSMAKPYQVKQVRTLILRYRLGASDEE